MEYLCESYFERPLEAQLVAACEAMRSWDDTIDMPSNPVLCLRRDNDNISLLCKHQDLSREVGYRIMDYHITNIVVRDAVRLHSRAPRPWLLGLVDATYPLDPAAMLIRELTARFVEAGVAACA